MAKTSVAFMQLSSCWGCHQSLLDSSLTLLHVLPELEFVYWPAVVDFKLEDLENYEDKSVDVGFCEGMVRTEQDKANAKLMRKKCKILVGMGSCAVYGGIPGMANLYSKEDLLKRKFEDEGYVDGGSKTPDHHVPGVLDSIPLLGDIVKLDALLPGCPPKSGNIVGLIASVLGQSNTKVDEQKSMCEVCPLETCLLEENKLCYGPITAAGDPIGQLAKGYPVLGEFGLTKNVHEDNAQKLLTQISAAPMKKDRVNKSVEAMIMLLSSTPLGYLAGKADPIRGVKLDPESVKMKKIQTSEGNEINVVDYTKEGYPDIVNNLVGAVLADLKTNPDYEDSAKTVCSQCDRNLEDKAIEKFKRDYEGFPDQEECLLNQGYVCMGPITKAGCGATCPRANSPCLGCYGPALNVEDFGAKALAYFPSLCADDPEAIEKFFSDPAGLFNRFTQVSSTISKRVEENK